MLTHIKVYMDSSQESKDKLGKYIQKYLSEAEYKMEDLAEEFKSELGYNYYRKNLSTLLKHLEVPEKSKDLQTKSKLSKTAETKSKSRQELVNSLVNKVNQVSSIETFKVEIEESNPYSYFTNKYGFTQHHTGYLCEHLTIEKPKLTMTFFEVIKKLESEGVDRDYIVKLHEESNMGYAAIASHLIIKTKVKVSDRQVKRIINELE